MMNSEYELATIQGRLDVLTGDDITKLEKEINIMEEKLRALELYQDLEFKKKELNAKKDRRQVQIDLVLEYMCKNEIKKIQWKGYDISVKNRKSIETVLEDIELVPQEYLRIKKELDKKKASDFYKSTGVMLDGIDFVHKDNVSLEITASKGGK